MHFTKNTQAAILRRNGTEEEELKGCCDHQGERLVAQTRILVIKVEKARCFLFAKLIDDGQSLS